MKFYNCSKWSFILAAVVTMVANGVIVKRAESSSVFSSISASISSTAEVERRKIADVQFEDSNLRRCVKDHGRTYVKDLFALHCNARNIVNTTGIEQLRALRIIHFNDNSITKINTSQLKHLIALYVSDNKIADIDLTKNSKLKRLFINNNKLSFLNVTDNRELESLRAINNDLSHLYLTNNHQLTQLIVSGNKLRKLNLHKNPRLIQLQANENRLKSLDVGNSRHLEHLSVNDNKLSHIRVASSKKLRVLRAIYNPLEWIYLTQNNSLKLLSFNEKVKCFGGVCSRAKHERARIKDIKFKDKNLEVCLRNSHPDALYVDQVSELDCSEQGITYTNGIEGLTALVSLNLRKNNIATIDVTSNVLLTELSLLNNHLSSIDVSRNKMLVRLIVGNNQLMNLNVRKNLKLVQLAAGNNQLADLNVSKNSALSLLIIKGNYLEKVDVTNNAELVDIRLDNDVFCVGEPCPQYMVDSQTGHNGQIAPKMLEVTHGHVAKFLVQPDVGYRIRTATGCGGVLEGNIYTTGIINERCRLYATFERPKLIDVAFADNKLRDCILDQHADKMYVEDIKSVSCNGLGISSTEGIEELYSLEELILRSNNLATVDVSSNTLLVKLSLLNNQLTTIDLTENTRLERLILGGNMLTNINTDSILGLRALLVNDNDLTDINVSNNIALEQLFALGNPLTKIDVSNNAALVDLRIDKSVICKGNACN